MAFADLDRAFGVVGANGYIGRWKMPSFQVICAEEADANAQWTEYKAIDFVKDPKEVTSSQTGENEPFQLGVVGTDERQ